MIGLAQTDNIEFYLILIIIGLIIGWVSTSGTKSQWVRLADVFLFGPLLIFAASQVGNVWLKIALIIVGASTMAYNLKNYLNEK